MASIGVNRDHIAGALMMTAGAGAAWEGSGNKLGSLQEMGPGFFPTAVGIVLTVIGAMIFVGPFMPGKGREKQAELWSHDLRGWLCIIAGLLCFILFARHGGLIPAAFSCVCVSALGDRTATLKGSLVLASGLALFSAVLFSYVLQVQLPLFQWQ